MEEVRSQCGVRVPEDGFDEDAGTEKRAVKRSEEEDEDGSGEGEESDDSSGEEESSDDDTTGDSNSSRGARGNGRVIQFGLVEDIFELSGAFSYGESTIIWHGTSCYDKSYIGLTMCNATLEPHMYRKHTHIYIHN